MDRKEILQTLHLALEGAVDQLTRAQDAAWAGKQSDMESALAVLLIQTTDLRNRFRNDLMAELGKPPTIRIGK